MISHDLDGVASIEYAGLSGITDECQDAILRMIQYGDRISHVRIISSSSAHALLLTVNVGDLVAIKSGFGSGYGGAAPHAFSYVLQLLEAHGAEIEEHEVSSDFIERLDAAFLTKADLEYLDRSRPVRPQRWRDYVFEKDWDREDSGTLWKEFPPVIPFAIVDPRIADLAISFWEGPDQKLLIGYRRLEDIIRQRTDLNDNGQKLFSQAFLGATARLSWDGIDDGEQNGRGNLFTAAFMAHRNPRAHREQEEDPYNQLSEFLLLNHLYRLESKARPRDAQV